MPQNAFFLRTHDLLVSQKTTQRHFLYSLHPLSTVIFATATVLAFVMLLDSKFNFHCYTQSEATPTQKSARKCAETSRDFFRERLQSAFTQQTSFVESPNSLHSAFLNIHRSGYIVWLLQSWLVPNSKHWFTTSFLQPLPYLVTP